MKKVFYISLFILIIWCSPLSAKSAKCTYSLDFFNDSGVKLTLILEAKDEVVFEPVCSNFLFEEQEFPIDYCDFNNRDVDMKIENFKDKQNNYICPAIYFSAVPEISVQQGAEDQQNLMVTFTPRINMSVTYQNGGAKASSAEIDNGSGGATNPSLKGKINCAYSAAGVKINYKYSDGVIAPPEEVKEDSSYEIHYEYTLQASDFNVNGVLKCPELQLCRKYDSL